MSGQATYTFTLIDKLSSPLLKIGGASQQTTERLMALQSKSKLLQGATRDLGGSLSVLRQKMELLSAEKEMIHPSNIKDIKRYNREIQSLEKQINKLDGTGRKSTYFSGLKSHIGGLINPVTMGITAIGMMVKGAMNLDEQFAKVNITAQLKGVDFEKMKKSVMDIATKNKTDVLVAPAAFEQILSQTNDVDLSLKILDATLKGSKAGFTDVGTVAGALVQSLSIIGKENASAEQVLDTFFMAKRVGAGEFKDFANYMPSLIAGASALGVGYKEVAGVFAYMTGKGQSAADASVLMGNMFSILGRKDVTDKLEGAGVGVGIFDDQGKMRSTVDIFKDLAKVFAKMKDNDKQKLNFMEDMGIVDKEAKSAFMVMVADTDKLSSSLNKVSNATGETDRALALSANSTQKATELWNALKGNLAIMGTTLLPVINGSLIVLSGALEVVSGAVSWWFTALEEGNPIIITCTAALGVLGGILIAHKIKLMAVSVATKITAATTGVLGKAFKGLSLAFKATAIGLIITGVLALTGVVMALSGKTDKVTRSFAQFNTELHKNKREAKDSFTAALAATEGSEARATAIAKINQEYGEYLPYLLTEKSSNEEIATALTSVNVQLETKINNKYRDKMMTDAMNTLQDVKVDVLDSLLDKTDVKQHKQLVADFHKIWQDISTGKKDFLSAESFFQDKYDIGTSLWSNLPIPGLGGGNLTQGWSDVGESWRDAQNAAYNYQQGVARIDMLYPISNSNTTPSSSVSTATPTPLSLSPTPSTATATPTTNSSQWLQQNGIQGQIDNQFRQRVTVGKVCENVIINVENTDGKGKEEVESVFMKLLLDIANG